LSIDHEHDGIASFLPDFGPDDPLPPHPGSGFSADLWSEFHARFVPGRRPSSSGPECAGSPGARPALPFAEDFARKPAPPPPAPPPGFSDLDLQRAREEAYAAGEAAGEAAAHASARLRADTALESSSQALMAALSAASRDARAAATVAATETSRLLLQLLSACLPDLCARHGAAEAAALADAVLKLVLPRCDAVVRCPPALLGPVRAIADRALPNRAGANGGRVTIEPDETMAQGDIHIAWEAGGAIRDTRTLLSGLDAALRPLGLRLGQPPVAARSALPEQETEHV
jgi:hypothetical protein